MRAADSAFRKARARSLAAGALVVLAGTGAARAQGAPPPEPRWYLSRASVAFDMAEFDRTVAGGSLTLVSTLDVTAAKGPWTAAVSLSHVRIQDPRQFDGTRPVRSGLGDLVLSGGYRTGLPWSVPASMGVTVLAKAPTASDRIGSGRPDGGVQLDVAAIVGGVTAFAVAGQWVTGKREGLGMRNPAYAMAGAQVGLGPLGAPWLAAGLYGFYRERTYARTRNTVSAVPYLVLTVGDRWELTAYGQAGLGRSSGDFGGGLRLSMTRF